MEDECAAAWLKDGGFDDLLRQMNWNVVSESVEERVNEASVSHACSCRSTATRSLWLQLDSPATDT